MLDVKREALSKRWPWVLLSLILMACTGALAVPAAWAVRVQVEAEQGERAPDAAVAAYLLRLSSGDDGGLRRVLAADRRDKLVSQWRAYRAQMSGPPCGPTSWNPVHCRSTRSATASPLVVTEDHAVWWHDKLSQSSSRHPWQAVHRWLRWYAAEGLDGLRDRSHRPQGHPAQISARAFSS